MANFLLLVQVNCADSTREKEFNQWYDEIHLPDMLKVPGVVKSTRYINLNPDVNKRPKYVVLYEIKTNDIEGFKKSFNENVIKAQKAGRMIDVLAPEEHYPFEPPFYKQIACQRQSKRHM